MPLRMYCSAIGGRPVHPHVLRLSFASRLWAKEADLQLIQEILGHESIQTTTMWHISTPLRTATAARFLQGGREMMQQIRIVADAARIPRTENMGLTLSDQPDQTWIARLRQLAAATEVGRHSTSTWRAPRSCSRARIGRISWSADGSSGSW